MSSVLETVVREPAEQADAAIVWLHGLGADANDFASLVPELALPATRFVFPNAPVRPVTVNGGMAMRAWYDFLSFEFSRGEDLAQLEESVELVGELVDEQIAEGIAPSRIVVGGFSQGGAVALSLAARHRGAGALAGIGAWSTYFPEQWVGETNWTGFPDVFMAHGSMDPVIPLAVGAHSRALLESNGVQVDWHEYPMQHQVCMEEIEAFSRWLAHRGLGR